MAISTEPYAELHAKTDFSFLEGASHPEEMVSSAGTLGLAALAVTDRNGVYGAVRAHIAAKASGVPLVLGSEITTRKGYIVLLASSRRGWGNLCRLISKARMKQPKAALVGISAEEISGHEADLLAFATAPYVPEEISDWAEIFRDRFSIALYRTLEASDVRRTVEALDLCKRFGVRLLAVNDVHYHAASRQPLADVLTAIRLHTTVTEAGCLLFPNAERRLKSPQEMKRLFRDRPDALHRSVELAERCSFSLDELKYVYPDGFLPQGKTADSHLRDLVLEGAKRTYTSGVPAAVRRQLEHELRLIAELRFAGYFLTIRDIVRHARERGILCQGRGSAANSAVCYVLGITAIDPVRMGLLFERFLSAERGEPPDIDVDFEHERREEVIRYIYARYGRERAGIVAQVTTYRTRSAIRDVAKALGMPSEEAGKLAKSYRRDFGGVTGEFLEKRGIDPESAFAGRLTALVKEIHGFPRHMSTHPGGFVLTSGPLVECVPVENAATPGRTILQWAKDDIAALGMLKVDILSLGILTCIRKCLDLVNRDKTLPLSLATIPAEDPKVYDSICAADTVGVFQIESRAQMGMLPRLRPRTFHDLVIEVAIVRPGPIQGGMVHPFLRRRRGKEKIRYAHEALKPILEKTCGIPLFQEQVMKIAVAVADFGPGEADALRRAMGIHRTARSPEIGALAGKLLDRMHAKGISRADSMEILQQIESFGEFGFPESHSASFALLVYASAYLKHYYPAAYACAILNSQPMGFYPPRSIVEDARRHKVSVLPVDVLFSDWDCTMEDGAMRLGFRLVRCLQKGHALRLVAEREKRHFDSIEDAVGRSAMNSIECFFLAAADGFRSFVPDRRQALWKIRALPNRSDDLCSGHAFEEPEVALPPLSDAERVEADYRTTGLSVFAHPVALLRTDLNRLGVTPSDSIEGLPKGCRVRAGGLVTFIQSPPTARGMVFLTLEDERGFVNAAIRPEDYKRLSDVVHGGPFLVVEGELRREASASSVLVKNAWPVS